MKKIVLILFFIAALSCRLQAQEDSGNIISENTKGYFSQMFGFTIHNTYYAKMYDLIADWLGTPYKYAGKNEEGIDCSGFVNKVYSTVFGKCIGTSAADMFAHVNHIKAKNLREGDLVFFKIKRHRISHVGIYLGQNKFAHASSSNGVMISDLNEEYYHKRFAKGGRVF